MEASSGATSSGRVLPISESSTISARSVPGTRSFLSALTAPGPSSVPTPTHPNAALSPLTGRTATRIGTWPSAGSATTVPVRLFASRSSAGSSLGPSSVSPALSTRSTTRSFSSRLRRMRSTRPRSPACQAAASPGSSAVASASCPSDSSRFPQKETMAVAAVVSSAVERSYTRCSTARAISTSVGTTISSAAKAKRKKTLVRSERARIGRAARAPADAVQ